MNKYSNYDEGMNVVYYSEGSKYLNNENLKGCRKTVNWFNDTFLNNGIRNHMRALLYANNYSGIPEMYKYERLTDLLPTNVLRRVKAAADFLYDESCFCIRPEDENSNKNKGFASEDERERMKNNNHEDNIRISTCILAMKLATWYAQPLTKYVGDAQSDRYITTMYYKIIEYYEASDIFDSMIKDANKKHFEMYEKDKVAEGVEPNIYEWDSNREYTFFSVITNRCIHNIYGYSLFDGLVTTISHRIDRAEYNMQRFDPKNIAYDIIKRAVIDINRLNCDLVTKNRLMGAMSKVMDDVYFNEIKEEELMRAVFSYGENRRPTIKCQKLFDEKYEEYKYEGVVYHGFRSYTNWGFKDPATLLRDYHDGFISCSKDLGIAAEFSGMFDDCPYDEMEAHSKNKECGSYVIEILIDENVKAIDAERLLRDIHGNYPERYSNLFESYEKEREVLLKLPMVSFNILSTEDVVRRLEKERAEKKKWENFNDVRKPATMYTDASDPKIFDVVKKTPEVVKPEKKKLD